ncbi:MAG TPA: bifunctional phosphopantothenoylcysteine decarboxylase/phosphopantothenate--cysteine ligase CoaBC, partial [Firmicutes bacterium]|nr:bifunctional phosphopantothenoylcysteine decarboxylase/phosphopantothenate--cysteine ligase CoaBC [Bacillota bacterium]
MPLHGKTVVVGISGGIAAYKAVEVVSRLRRLGAEVQVIMTRAATHFVTPLTFQTISGQPVVTNLFTEPKRWNVEHIALAERADLLLVVPATANVVGKVACGIADDFLTTTILATRARVVFAPAMHHGMFTNPIFQSNMQRLQTYGYHFIPPERGRLASGGTGWGRLPDPETIVAVVKDLLLAAAGSPGGSPEGTLAGIRVLVTAGPTREPIDAVRFITNASSGKMGYALARAAQERGAKVTLVSGPTALPDPPGVEVIRVVSAQDMYREVMARAEEAQLVLKAAAVGDWRPRQVYPRKLKKGMQPATGLTLELEANPDILAELGARKGGRVLVGFAAETDDLDRNAREKLTRKNLDLLVVNDVNRPGAGFATD